MNDLTPVMVPLSVATQRLGVSERWLRDFLKGRSCYRRAGRKLLFTEGDLYAIAEAMKCRSDSIPLTAPAPRTGESVERTLERALILARGLPTERASAQARRKR